MQHVRVDHDPQRQLLQVHELRDDLGLRLRSLPTVETLRARQQSGAKNAEADLRVRLLCLASHDDPNWGIRKFTG